MGDRNEKSTQANIQRRRVLKTIGTSALTIGVASSTAISKESYPTVTHEHTSEPVKNLVVDSEQDPQIDSHPQHDRIAFSTTTFDDGFELYVADGVSSESEVAETIYKVTDNTTVGVFDIEWLSENTLRYWQDSVIYKRTLPPSHKVFEAEKVGTQVIPNSVETAQGDDN